MFKAVVLDSRHHTLGERVGQALDWVFRVLSFSTHTVILTHSGWICQTKIEHMAGLTMRLEGKVVRRNENHSDGRKSLSQAEIGPLAARRLQVAS